jgi:hypothetical protein
MNFGKKKQVITTDLYVNEKLTSIKKTIIENKTLVCLCVLGGVYYAFKNSTFLTFLT